MGGSSSSQRAQWELLQEDTTCHQESPGESKIVPGPGGD